MAGLRMDGRTANPSSEQCPREQQRVAIARALANRPQILLPMNRRAVLILATSAVVFDLNSTTHNVRGVRGLGRHTPIELASLYDRC